MRDVNLVPPRNEVSRVGDRSRELREDPADGPVARAVRNLRRAEVRPNGLFKHPPDFNEEELAIIVDGLKGNVPEQTIASLVNCERHTLARYIAKTPELRQLKEDQNENLYQTAVYQADRLMKAGNASIVIFALQTLGRKRGWSTEDIADESGEDQGRIIMGVIPDEEVEAAKKTIEESKKELPIDMTGSPDLAAVDPLKAELAAEQAKDEIAFQKRIAEEARKRRDEADRAAGRLVDVEPSGGDGGSVSQDPMEGGGMAEEAAAAMEGGYDGFGGGGPMDDMPPDGLDSMFYQ